VNALDDFLARTGLAPPDAKRTWHPLFGGVSSDIWRVDIAGRASICVKRALSTLKVADHWEAPVSRNAYEWAWMRFTSSLLPGVVPQLLGHDPEAGLFAMEFLPPEQYPTWKQLLLAGHVDPATAQAVGQALGQIHDASAHRPNLEATFDTTVSFHALRLEPYLETAARRHPRLSAALHALVERTATTRIALVHGDVSPKNILVGPNGPVFLDAECAWYGDPSFDIAFCLTHLLLKYAVQPSQIDRLRASFDAFAEGYFVHANFEPRATLEGRAAALLPALLLARVDGKSPVEYLKRESVRDAIRCEAAALIGAPTTKLGDISDRWFIPRPEFALA
jgi:tRNA A-37 threonylcarbamoyl transferase component Bud32